MRHKIRQFFVSQEDAVVVLVRLGDDRNRCSHIIHSWSSIGGGGRLRTVGGGAVLDLLGIIVAVGLGDDGERACLVLASVHFVQVEDHD